MTPLLLVSMHDVAPATLDECRAWIDLLDERDVPSTLLAVPGPWRGRQLRPGDETAEWLWARAAGGDEVGLHGWVHTAPSRRRPTVRDRAGHLVARGAEEFWGLSDVEAARRLRRGLDVLGDAGLSPVGFTPPGWLINRPGRRAAGACGLQYVADHLGVTNLRTRVRRRAPALSHRPTGTVAETIGARAMTAVATRRAARGQHVRIALHPADLHRPGLVAATLDAIDATLAAGSVAVTYAAALGATTSTTTARG